MNNWQQLRADYLWSRFTANFSHSNSGFLKVITHNPLFSLPLLILIIFLVLLILLFRFIFRLKKTIQEVPVILEITPPSHTEKTAYTTTQLYCLFN